MDPIQASILIMQILNLLASVAAPLVTALAYFIQHVSKSSCCGGGLEMRAPSNLSSVAKASASINPNLIIDRKSVV